ncbi:hypothetical protein, partial [Chryseobacterium sp.]|uniref:hypothetical protein n=1 Tax=Chryseobacterium sp. TaxID=1871047 RepID=UPI002FC6CECB
MKKFLNGEREFTQNQIVYFIERDGAEQSVSFGKVDRYVGGGVFRIIIYDYPQLTNIHSASFLWKFAEV